MATFKIPDSPTFNYLDLNNLQGMDSWDTNPNVMRSTDMLNIIKKEGLHQVRHNVVQSYLVGNYGTPIADDDLTYPIKYVGKIEEYDENGNTVPYYIKISEYLGRADVENDSKICISVWPTPNVKNIKYDMSQMEGFEDYIITYKTIPFTNYGESGNRQGLYEHIQFDGKERVFTPIGILSFSCSTENISETNNGVTTTYKQLVFDIENVLDNPYVPTIVYGSTPDGLDFTKYESINLLTDKRKVQFLSDGVSDTYNLPEKHISTSNFKISELQSDGTFVEIASTEYTLNPATGVIIFDNAPSLSPIDGKDNIIVEYEINRNYSSTETVVMRCTAGDNLFNMQVTVDRTQDTQHADNLILSINAVFSGGSNFNRNDYILRILGFKIQVPGFSTSMNNATNIVSAINNNQTFTYTRTAIVPKSKFNNNSIWSSTLTCTYTHYGAGTQTIVTPGKVGEKVVMSTTQIQTSQFNWMGFNLSGEAEGTVGTRTDGSDSYWTVKEKIQLWLSKKEYLNCGAGTLIGIIDGEEITAGSTGNMLATSTKYPSTPLTVTKRIDYASNKNSVTLSGKMNFYANINGTVYRVVTCGNKTMNLPLITLPTETTTTDEDITLTEIGSYNYQETPDPVSDITYDNVVPGSARLACYYGAKAVTVYGYESDRRVFVSDGTNKDTYSGITLNGTSSIYYFPDDNYNVLGENTEILGYAQKHGYLLTFKRGEDSVYVRYGTSINDETVFPSTVVTRNLQVLSRPIQINDEVLVVTRNGIKSINYISNEVRAELRSYFINNYFELSADYDYDRMSWFVDNNLLHIFLNKYEFTADLVSKSYIKEGAGPSGTSTGSNLDFQYEWYVSEFNWIDNRKAPQVTIYQPKDFERQSAGIDYEHQRAIGYSPEGIYEFSYNDYKVDRINQVVDGNKGLYIMPIKAHYITPFLNMGAINVAKTIKYVYINTRSETGDMFAVGYIDENGTTETMEKIYNNINDYTTKQRNSMIPFPKLIQIKSKIRKFMNVKLYIQNRAELENTSYILPSDEAKYANMTFDRILIQYQISGKYRGE